MRCYTPDYNESTGGSADHRSSGTVPSVMDNDPRADEEVIDQQAGDEYPRPTDQSAKIAPENLADSIAYALDGSGPGPLNEAPNVTGHKVITEGVTGAGPEDEEEALRSLLPKR